MQILGSHVDITPEPWAKFIQVSCASSANCGDSACAGETELCALHMSVFCAYVCSFVQYVCCVLHAKQSILPAFNDIIHITVHSLPAMSLLHPG